MNKFVEKYGQILLPLITPYDEEENVNYGTYAQLIDYVVENDLCDSLIVTGTVSQVEASTMAILEYTADKLGYEVCGITRT